MDRAGRALAALNYAGNLARDGEPDREVLYRWSSSVGGLIQYTLILLLLLAIARGLLARGARPATARLLGPRRRARRRVSLVAIWVVAAGLGLFLDAGDEQGLVPDEWDGSRWAPFLANAVVVVVAAPVVEELTYRSVGFAPFDRCAATCSRSCVTSLAFGLAHGLVVALPVLTAFGVVLGWLRLQDGQRLPVHGAPRHLQRRRAARGRDDRRRHVSDRFDEIRAAIDATDLALVGLVNERLRLVAELWEIKRSSGDRPRRSRAASGRSGPRSLPPTTGR